MPLKFFDGFEYKYSVGDVVRLCTKEEIRASEAAGHQSYWITSMNHLIGKTVTISERYSSSGEPRYHIYEDETYFFNENMIAGLVASPSPMLSFDDIQSNSSAD